MNFIFVPYKSELMQYKDITLDFNGHFHMSFIDILYSYLLNNHKTFIGKQSKQFLTLLFVTAKGTVYLLAVVCTVLL